MRDVARRWCFVVAVLAGCVAVEGDAMPAGDEPAPVEPAPGEPLPDDPDDPTGRNDVEGCNCAGASPALQADDGVVYPFQSVVAYYYRVVDAWWQTAGNQSVLVAMLPPHLYAHEAFFSWLAKTVQIYAEPGVLGFAHGRYYRGAFGRVETPSGMMARACRPALDEDLRTVGMLAHVGLSQAGVCGTNDDGTTKFWQVNRISLLRIGDAIDAYALVRAGLAVGNADTQEVTYAPAERCALAAEGFWHDAYAPTGVPRPDVPCRVAFRADAVTEGVVIAVPSPTTSVSGIPLVQRPFTAAGIADMPGDLDEVRVILRDEQLRVMYALGLPRFEPAPEEGPTHVRLIGHRVGPTEQPSSVLLPEERGPVDLIAGTYEDRCCRLECEDVLAAVLTPPVCTQVCVPERICDSAMLHTGLVVMVSALTTRECFGNCPEPASGAPGVSPSCSLQPPVLL